MSSLGLIYHKTGDRLTISQTAQSSGALQYEIEPFRTAEGIPAGGAVFGSELNIDFKPSGTRMWLPNQSYLEIRVRTCAGTTGGASVKLGDAGATAGGNISPAPMQVATLFRSARFTAGGNELEAISDSVAQLSAYLHRTSEWEDQVIEGTKVGWEAPSMMVSQTAAERRANLARTQIRTYQWRPPLGIMSCDKPLPSGDYRISVGLDAGGFVRAFQSLDGAISVLATDKLAAPTTNATGAGTAAQQAYFEVVDITFCAAMVDYGDAARVSGEIVYPLTYYEVKKQQLTSTSDDVTVKVKPTATRNTIAFQDARAATGALNRYYTPCIFSPTPAHGTAALGNTAFPAPAGDAAEPNNLFNVIGLQMFFAGHPSTKTNLKLYYNNLDDTMVKAWSHWCDSVGLSHPESYGVWLQRGPLFSFSSSNVRDPADRSQELRVLVERANEASGSTMLVISEYEVAVILTVVGGEIVDARKEER